MEAERQAPDPMERNPARMELQQVRDYMERHFAEPLSIAALAQLAGLRPKYFVTAFKKTFGQSAIAWLTSLRIGRAKRYLLETDWRMRDIAQKVGYSDEFYFSRKFKKETGLSPSDFVKKRKTRIAACTPSMIGQLLALRVVPVTAPLDPKWTPYYYLTCRSDIEAPLPYDSLQSDDWRQWLQARPDAIIGDERLPVPVRQQLEQAAPALFLPAGTMHWRDQLRHIAHFLSRDDIGRDWLQRYDRKAALARERLAPVIGRATVATLRLCGETLYLYRNRGMHDVLFGDLQLRPAHSPESGNLDNSALDNRFAGNPFAINGCLDDVPSGTAECASRIDGFTSSAATGHSGVDEFKQGEAVASFTGCNTAISLEQLSRLDPDRILIVVCPEPHSRASWLSLQHNTAWNELKAARSGHIHPIPSDPWLEYSAVALSRMVDEMLLLFTGYNPKQTMDNVHGGRGWLPL